jgi:peptidyl-prolyl cis-trans isomerase C
MKSVPYLALLFLLTMVMACAQKEAGEKVLARINNYEIGKDEFKREFKESIFGAQDTEVARREFLNHLINQKLILQDAQRRGLDKTRGFLGAIENFWEQTLLRTALEQKIEGLAGSFAIPEQEVRSLYNRRMEAGVINTSYEKASSLLRREISKSKETQALSFWIDGLRKKAKIRINEDLLK